MVDTYGRWTYIPGTSEEKKCDMDRLADRIYSDGYRPKDLERLCSMVFMAYDEYLEGNEEAGVEYDITDVAAFVEESGGWQEFDYDI